LKKVILFITLLVPLLAGCGANVYMENFVPEETDATARSFIRSVKLGDYAAAEKVLNPEFVTDGLRDQLGAVTEELSGGEITSIELVKFNNTYRVPDIRDVRRSYLYYQVEVDGAFHRVFAVVDSLRSGDTVVQAFYSEPLQASLEEMNAFTLTGKGFKHYLMVLVALVEAAFILFTAYLCFNTAVERRYSWLVLILFGVGSLSLNWTTGALDWNWFTAVFLGAGFLPDGLHGPWTVSVSIPFGAIFFYLKHGRAAEGLEKATEG